MSTQYTEIFDVRKLQYIINNWNDKQFIDDDDDKEYKDKTETILKKYFEYSRFYKDHQNIIKVNYSQKNKNIGRFFAKGSLSLQSLPRQIRHTIAKEFINPINP